MCEVAGSLDILLDGPGGWPVEPGWWQRTQTDCQDQIDRYCHLCGMCVPMDKEFLSVRKERFTPKLAELFKSHGLRNMGDESIEIVDLKLTRDQVAEARKTWTPWRNRPGE